MWGREGRIDGRRRVRRASSCAPPPGPRDWRTRHVTPAFAVRTNRSRTPAGGKLGNHGRARKSYMYIVHELYILI